MMEKKYQYQFIFIIKICCFLVFFGRGWQHFFWDAPFRTILWNQGLLSGVIESVTSMTWQEYVTSPKVDLMIQSLIKAFGIFYFIMAFFSLWINSRSVKLGKLLLLGFLSLLFLTFLYFMGKNFNVGMFIEHATQFGLPLVLYLCLYRDNFFKRYLLFFKLLIAMTFIGHGLFAFGYYPVPGHFIDMIISILKTDESNALYLLKAAGTFDFIASLFLFVPGATIYALGFNIFWGTATAFARMFAHIDPELMEFTSHQWVFETIYRLPHGLFPLALFLYLLKRPKSS